MKVTWWQELMWAVNGPSKEIQVLQARAEFLNNNYCAEDSEYVVYFAREPYPISSLFVDARIEKVELVVVTMGTSGHKRIIDESSIARYLDGVMIIRRTTSEAYTEARTQVNRLPEFIRERLITTLSTVGVDGLDATIDQPGHIVQVVSDMVKYYQENNNHLRQTEELFIANQQLDIEVDVENLVGNIVLTPQGLMLLAETFPAGITSVKDVEALQVTPKRQTHYEYPELQTHIGISIGRNPTPINLAAAVVYTPLLSRLLTTKEQHYLQQLQKIQSEL